MRTVDPETWYTKVKGTWSARKVFGSQSESILENRLRTSFMYAMKDFWANSSIESVKYMRERNMPRRARRCYIIFLVVLMVLGLLMLVRSWKLFHSVPPLVVTLLSSQHPVRHVDFPAVALCPTNIISKTAVKNYASYLYSLDENGTYALEDIERNLLTFGSLVTWSGPKMDVAFMEFLARVAHETNTTDVAMKLSPRCSRYLVRCAWRAVRVPCGGLFALRATPLGYCCVFNSRYQDEDLHNPARRLHFVGQDSGLSIVVRKDYGDGAYLRGPGDGVEVLLFDGNDYPLIEGAATRMYLMHHETSAFLKLSVKAQYTASYLDSSSDQWRGCRMRHPRSQLVGQRSQAWCLTTCRRRTVEALCGCVPHLLLPQPGDTVCSPDQLPCLNKHKEKFTNFYPGDFADSSLSEESSDSLFCEHCIPDCTRLVYSAAASFADHQFKNKIFLNFFVSGLTLINSTVIRIYYASQDQKIYIVESNRRWHEVALMLGSQWLCVVAVTVVGVVELVYHVTIRWSHHFIRRRRFTIATRFN